MAERLKRENDWRFEYIQRKKFGIKVSPFIALNVLEKAKRKETTFAERLITRKDYGVDTDYDIQMTEVYINTISLNFTPYL